MYINPIILELRQNNNSNQLHIKKCTLRTQCRHSTNAFYKTSVRNYSINITKESKVSIPR